MIRYMKIKIQGITYSAVLVGYVMPNIIRNYKLRNDIKQTYKKQIHKRSSRNFFTRKKGIVLAYVLMIPDLNKLYLVESSSTNISENIK